MSNNSFDPSGNISAKKIEIKSNIEAKFKVISFLALAHSVIVGGFMAASVKTHSSGYKALCWAKAKAASLFWSDWPIEILNTSGQLIKVKALSIVNSSSFKVAAANQGIRMALIALGTSSIYLFYPMLMKKIKKVSRKYIRGSKLLSTNEYNKLLDVNKIKTDLPLGSIDTPIESENRHTLIPAYFTNNKKNELLF